MVTIDFVEKAYEYGLRAIGPAHYGPGRYAPGTGSRGGLETGCKELLEEMEEDDGEGVIDWSAAAFTMDDVTIDVKQYGKDDAVVTKQKPSFAFTMDLPDSSDDEEEEYELKPEDAPEFVTKFEVPETEEEPLEVIEAQQLSLIHI